MRKNKLLFILFLLLTGSFSFGQYTKESLQKQSARLRQEITELNKALTTNKNETKTSIVYISNLNKKIDTRTKLINTTRKESRFLDDEIYLNQLEINKLKRELAKLRNDYADVLIRSYKNKSIQNKVLFILSSDNISQAFRRIKYLQKYAEFQNKKVDEINNKQKEILKTIELREKAKKEKLNILTQQEVQVKKLDGEKKEKEQVVAQYIKQQGDLASKIQKKQSERQALERQVQAIIAEEVRIAKAKEAEERRKAEEAELARKKTIEEERAKKALEAKMIADKIAAEKAAAAKKAQEAAEAAKAASIKEANDRLASKRAEDAEKAAKRAADEKIAAERLLAKKDSEAKLAEAAALKKREELGINSPSVSSSETLSKSFEANKKSLPWPVAGSIISQFGKSPHPVISGIIVEHHGIEIAANPGSLAKAVFGGTVSRIIAPPGGGKAVLIKHGNYFTLYANLQTVIVSVGDVVKTGQAVGKIYTDDTNNTILDFQVWKGISPENPANWLSGM